MSMAVRRNGERGSALVYILIAIALLGALTVTFMEPSSQQTSSQNTFRTVSGVQSQADTIRAAIQECVLNYPGGDTTIDITGGGSDPGARTYYPIKPNSTHFAAATVGPTAGPTVRDLRCPGNPGNNINHVAIFSGSSGRFMPPAPDLFNDWQYYNGTDGIFFWVDTDKSDAFILTALEKMDENFSECEADVVDASAAARDLDAAGTIECAAGSVCFRVRMITNGSAVWNGDTGGDEGAC